MTEFIDSFSTQQLLPPWEAVGAQTWGFAIRMHRGRLEAYLEKYFNSGYPDQAPFRYAPLPGPQFALLMACYFPSIASNNPTTQSRLGAKTSWDHVTHTEVYLAVPVIRHAVTEHNLLVDPKVVWVQPFVCSDNASVVFASREIWGVDMTLATIMREEALPGGQLHLDTAFLGIRTFNPRSVNQLLACLHIATGAMGEVELDQVLKHNSDLEELVKLLSQSGVFAGSATDGATTSDSPQGIELNDLKQFRDAYNMAAAIYRAIVASRTAHTGIRDIAFYDPAAVEIDFMWSDSIAETLASLFDIHGPNHSGPPAAHLHAPPPTSTAEVDWRLDRASIPCELAFAFTSDVTFEVLRTLYTYGVR